MRSTSDVEVYVVDASVAVKWVVYEVDSEAALAVADSGPDLVAPDLILVEVANAIRKRVRAGEIGQPEALEAYRDLVAAPLVRLAVDDALGEAALQLALELDHPVQDCLYLALAARHDARVITADRKFAGAVHASARHADRIVLLDEVAT